MGEPNPPENRNIDTGGGNYNERIEGDYIDNRQSNVFKRIILNVSQWTNNIFIEQTIAPVSIGMQIFRQEYHNRQALLNKVNNYWIKGVLEKSLYKQVLVTISLEERFDLLADPWNLIDGEQEQEFLPQNTKVIDVFDRIGEGRTLLIIGEPGSGKTITLLELTRHLLARARQDINHLIPVVLNLSSWVNEKQTIANWLLEELNTKYQVPKKIGISWIEKQQLLPLFDGLDEVKTEYREACIAALNAFHQEYALEIVICSRIKDYESISKRLNFQSAIYLRPLTSEQVDFYLNNVGANCQGIRELIERDKALQELAASPLMLNLITLAYSGLNIKDLSATDLVEERRQQLFNIYIESMFNRRGNNRYSKAKVKFWLSWVAQIMFQESQTIFLIEQLQPILLQNWMQKAYIIGVELFTSLIILLCNLPFIIFILEENNIIFFYLAYSLIDFLKRYLLCFDDNFYKAIKIKIEPVERMKFVPSRIINLLKCFINILHFFIKALINIPIWFYRVFYRVFDLIKRWKYLLIIILLFGYSSPAIIVAYIFTGEEIIAQIIAGFYRTLNPKKIFISLINLLVWFTFVWLSPAYFITHLVMLLLFNIILYLIFSNFIIVSEIEIKVIPNQGIIRSFVNAGFTGLIAWLIFGVIAGLIHGVFNSYVDTSQAFGLTFGLAFGLSYGIFLGGGKAFIKHFILRLLFYFNSYTPWNYALFLDYTTELDFLRKVGGGYIFTHRLLLEHFAQMEFRRD